MDATLERELKLSAPAGFVLPPLGGEPLPTRIFVSNYHDTPDARLAQVGVTLRHRVENGTGRWQLKLPRAGARLELERIGGPASVPDEMLALLPALLRGRTIGQVARLQTRRRGVLVDGVEIVLDDVTVLEGLRVRGRFTEIEAELLDPDDEKALRRVEKLLLAAGAGPSSGRPKVFQALGIDPEAGAPTLPLAAAVRAQLVEMLRFDPGTRLGDDPEDLHQFRVASRRLRALLRAARELLDPVWAEETRLELAWLGGIVGEVRDLDVLIERLDVEVHELDGADLAAGIALVRLLRSDRSRARKALHAAFADPRYTALLDRLEAGPVTLGEHEADALELMAAAERKRLRRAAKELPDDPQDEQLHALRIKVKRARYAAELVPGAKTSPFVRRAKTAQDVLGEHQDAVVAEEKIRALAVRRKTVQAALAAGRLIERERRRAARSRRAFPRAWADLEREMRTR
jgi:CHAD domain-containing protein